MRNHGTRVGQSCYSWICNIDHTICYYKLFPLPIQMNGSALNLAKDKKLGIQSQHFTHLKAKRYCKMQPNNAKTGVCCWC